MPPKLLYFDLGNVLLSFSHDRMCRQMADVAGLTAEAVRDAIFGKLDAQAAQWEYETGLISTDEYFDFFCRATGTRPDRARLAEAVCDIFAPIEATWDLVRRLAAAATRQPAEPFAGCPPLAILSNTNRVQWQFIIDGRFPLLANPGSSTSPFGWAILSFEVHSMKPDRAIYDAAIERAGLHPGEIFFTDDRPENVARAVAAGIDAVQFTSCENLIADLKERGVAGS